MRRCRLLLVDDHRAFAEAVAVRLAHEPDMEVVGIATTAAHALALAESLRPDVVVLDVCLGLDSGIDVAAAVRQRLPDARVVMVTMRDDAVTGAHALRAGAAAFVGKEASADELLAAVRGVTRGETVVHPRLLGGVISELIRPTAVAPVESDLLRSLTDRERQVLECMVRGLDRSSIAEELFLSTNTVRTHTRNLFAKLGVHSSLEAVSVARRAGIGARV